MESELINQLQYIIRNINTLSIGPSIHWDISFRKHSENINKMASQIACY
jgi:hypothetical protein